MLKIDKNELLRGIREAESLVPLKKADSNAPKVQFKVLKKPKHAYGDQLLCLLSLCFMAVWRSGWRALTLTLCAIIVSVFCDWLFCRMSKKVYNPKDISTICTGLCFSLMLPASVSYWLVGAGALLAIGVKHIFGGKDNYIFNPASVSLAFLIICYPSQMLLYPKVGEMLPMFGDFGGTVLSSGLDSYMLKQGTAGALSSLDIILGNFQGAMGTTHILVILICAFCLLLRRSISPTVTLITAGVFVLTTLLFPIYGDFTETLYIELVSGQFLFCIVFLANDPQTLPKTLFGRAYYGLVLGLTLMLFRYFAKVEASAIFALLLANALSVSMDGLADLTVIGVKKLNRAIKSSLTSFENFRKRSKEGKLSALTDTQEIIIPEGRYNMPPIDNKVIRVERKRSKLSIKLRAICYKVVEVFLSVVSAIVRLIRKIPIFKDKKTLPPPEIPKNAPTFTAPKEILDKAIRKKHGDDLTEDKLKKLMQKPNAANAKKPPTRAGKPAPSKEKRKRTNNK